MKALTICQPYAHLIATGEKWVENRTWQTSHRGSLVIHAGKSRKWLTPDSWENPDRCCGILVSEMAFGAFIAFCDLVACVSPASVRNRERDAMYALEEIGIGVDEFLDHEHTVGPYCFVLKNVRKFDPVPCRGMQGLWTV